MRKYVFWGLLLIVVGVIWLLKISDVIYFSWRDFLSLWPLVLIWAGISFLPIKDGYKIGLDLVTMALGIGLLIVPIQHKRTAKKHVVYEKSRMSSTYTIDKEYKTADLDLTVGAVELRLQPGNNTLAEVEGDKKEYVELNVSMDDEAHAKVKIKIAPDNPPVTSVGRYTIVLDTLPVWKMDVSMGASDNMIDLSSFKIEKLELATGASNLDLKLGDLYPEMDVDLSVGASSVTINIPRTMNCRIDSQSVLSEKHFDEGFEKKERGKYYSAAKDTIKGTITLHISSGVSDIRVVRY